jgi:ABC-type transport system involved in multi-copper enzyme maturation permease subunit
MLLALAQFAQQLTLSGISASTQGISSKHVTVILNIVIVIVIFKVAYVGLGSYGSIYEVEMMLKRNKFSILKWDPGITLQSLGFES